MTNKQINKSIQNGKNAKLPNFFIGLFIGLLGYLFIGLFSPVARAQTSFSISPPIYEVKVNPGQMISSSIKLTNNSDHPLSLVVTTHDFVVRDQSGTPEIIADKSNPYSASSWITTDNSQVVLSPKESREIIYNLVVPQNASPGGHYVVFVAEAKDEPVLLGSNANVASSIGSLLYITVTGNIKEQAKISLENINPFQEYGPINFDINIKNLGNIHIRPYLNITLYNIFGNKTEEISSPDQNIFPGINKIYHETLGSKWMFGRYTVNILGGYGENNNIPLHTSFVVWILPWKMIILGSLILAGLATMVWFIFRRY